MTAAAPPPGLAPLLAPPWHEDPERLLQLVGEAALAAGAVQFECRAEEVTRNVLVTANGALERTEAKESRGLGVTVRLGTGAEGFAATTDWSPAAAQDAAARAVRLARAMRVPRALPEDRSGLRLTLRPDVRRHPRDATIEERLDILARAEAALTDAGVKRAKAGWGEMHGRRIVWTSDDRYVEMHPLHATLEVQAGVPAGAGVAKGSARYASCFGLEHLTGAASPEALADAALKDAREAAIAKAMPAGRFPAILDPHVAGVLAHESFGHMSEYDCVRAGWSVLGGRDGERLGPDGVSITDSGACARPGGPAGVWVPVDDEGTRAEDVHILQDGVLNAFMHKRETAAEAPAAPRGNGRAVSVRHPALVRMRNTFFEPGDATLDDMLREMRNGYYVRGSSGGEPSSDGSFVYAAFRAYEVKDGEIGAPLRGVTLVGNILDYLPRIRAVGNDLTVQSMFFGGCGKWGQMDLPVGVGGPHLHLDEVLFGGESA